MDKTCGCGCQHGMAAGPADAVRLADRETVAAQETVEGAVRWSPRAAEVLRGLGVDTCCGGRLTLAQAAASAGIPVETVLKALVASQEDPM